MRFGSKIGCQLLALSMLLSPIAQAKSMEQYHPHVEETSQTRELGPAKDLLRADRRFHFWQSRV